ncbi:MAG: cob(I)yrinic acid a,c-diamide adenosyltransferase [Elusimicrobiota bacterium]
MKKTKKQNIEKKTGLIQSYTGKGRGKTSAAAGLALRAKAAGLNVFIMRFLKNKLPEDQLLQQIGIKVQTAASFYNMKNPDNPDKIKTAIYEALELIKSNHLDYDMIVLDEILVALNKGFIEEERLLNFICGKPKKLELILTGRGLSQKIKELSDLVSDITEVKHPFSAGIQAREGIDK